MYEFAQSVLTGPEPGLEPRVADLAWSSDLAAGRAEACTVVAPDRYEVPRPHVSNRKLTQASISKRFCEIVIVLVAERREVYKIARTGNVQEERCAGDRVTDRVAYGARTARGFDEVGEKTSLSPTDARKRNCGTRQNSNQFCRIIIRTEHLGEALAGHD